MSGSTSTNVPAPSFTDQGFVAPSESAILAGRLADLNAAFGGNLNIESVDGTPELRTPQGQIATSETAAIGDANSLFLALANGVDPAYASGRMQDAIGRIYYIERIAAASTVTQVACNGAQGVAIPTGALLLASDGNQYVCTGGGNIPAGGTITLPFACATVGPIACPAQTFTIYRTINGWDSATSSAAGELGNLVESRAAFEARRSASVALNARDSVDAIRAAVLSVSGVLDAYVVDNPTGSSVTIGGVTLLPHSVYIAVVGGASADIAAAIWNKKSLGCNYNGSTTVQVQDTNGYALPYPTYAVSFQIPTPTQVNFLVTLSVNAGGVPADALTQIQNALISAFSGGDGGPRMRVGSTIYASRFYSTIAALGSWAQVVAIQIGTGSGTPSAFQLTLPVNQVPVISSGGISYTLA